MDDTEPDEDGFRALLEAIRQHYGHDFSHYTGGPLHRRARRILSQEGVATFAALQDKLVGDPPSFRRFLGSLCVPVTEMFREPDCFRAFRQHVVPFLRTYPRIKAWIAGCATGEEAYSLAILLEEEGLLGRSIIHATDVSPVPLEQARRGIYPVDRIRRAAENHARAGGSRALGAYFHVAHGHATVHASLRESVHVAEHNLATDQVFGEMQVILCRNVLIYFDRVLQAHTVALFQRSLVEGGFLGVGAKESLRLIDPARAFQEVAPGSKIYRKKVP